MPKIGESKSLSAEELGRMLHEAFFAARAHYGDPWPWHKIPQDRRDVYFGTAKELMKALDIKRK